MTMSWGVRADTAHPGREGASLSRHDPALGGTEEGMAPSWET